VLQDFIAAVTPLAEALRGIDLTEPAAAHAEVTRRAPFGGPLVAAVRAAVDRGIDGGWLATREQGGVRFGRAAKDLCGFSVDVVEMACPGPRHRHPNGEIDLCFALGGRPTFDGHPEGWVVYGPDSTHVPTVAGGTMRIVYFLPGGAIEWVQK
jgi:hypothetical protein